MEELVDLYRERLEPDQLLLQALAVVYEPINQSQLRAMANAMSWPFANSVNQVWRDELLESGLMDYRHGKLTCPHALKNLLAFHALKQGNFEALALAAERVVPSRPQYGFGVNYYTNPTRRERQIRDAFLTQDDDDLIAALDLGSRYEIPDDTISLLNAVLPGVFEWFDSLSPLFRYHLVNSLAANLDANLTNYELCFQLLTRPTAKHTDVHLRALLAEQYLYRGQMDAADALISTRDDYQSARVRGIRLFMAGNIKPAIIAFESALKSLRRDQGTRATLPALTGLFYALTLVKAETPASRKKLARHSKLAGQDHYEGLITSFDLLLEFRGEWDHKRDEDTTKRRPDERVPLNSVIALLASQWMGRRPLPGLVAAVQDFRNTLSQDLVWFTQELDALLAAVSGEPAAAGSLVALMPKSEPWERALAALTNLQGTPSTTDAEHRLIWTLERYGDNGIAISPREQKRGKRGWSRGRNVALKRLADDDAASFMTDADRQITRHIEPAQWRSGMIMNHERAVIAAAGHPLVFWKEDLATPIEIRRREPELSVRRVGEKVIIAIYPTLSPLSLHEDPPATSVTVPGTSTLDIYHFTDAHRQICQVLGEGGLTVPDTAEDRVLESITAISPLLTIHSELDGSDETIETRVADRRLYVNIQPRGDGMKLDIGVQPFGPGPRFLPGAGGSSVIAEIAGTRMRADRDLEAEIDLMQSTLARCPRLFEEGPGRWRFDELEEALEGLLALQALPNDVVCAWPEGKRITIRPELGSQSMSMSIRARTSWFDVGGEIRIDESQVLELQKLITIMQNSPGRFIELGDDEFVAITDDLKKRLDQLGSVFEDGKVQRLAGFQLEAATDGIELDSDGAWLEFRARLEAARDLSPALPTTFQGTLREYQLDGFHWLARLAEWGAGACLADDMGLGKTIQAIALMLLRAEAGPAIIIAPTSVCSNWVREIARFAPALRTFVLGPGDRGAMINDLAPGDVLVTSYGLLAGEIDKLSERTFATAVADEAQAFKNAGTQRSRAMMQLVADFRVITTGTPVENHLGELWNLFHFINRGLLGTLSHFTEVYSRPIVDGDEAASERLRNLTSPFILRRLKSEVLTELPPRTDITLNVALSDEETALYEALRREAASELESAADNNMQMITLARITRLRRAVCNPALVLPESGIASSKLQRLEQLVGDLIENDHRALVFSQFVSHLKLIAERFDELGFSYQYLDGKTPVKQRDRAVEAFQAGDGQLFLISLKAGGTGLNLTAADYVIHMDPWWNPAIEDQASDRAHRIGQLRPVTVYRLIAEDTIEQKIVELHARKRELASELLRGADIGAKLTFEEMLSLIDSG